MAATVPLGFDDVLLANLKTKLKAFRAAQVALDSHVNFDIDIDRGDPWNTERPLVNLVATDDPADTSKSSLGIRSGFLTVKAQCFAPKKSARLRYLKAQVLEGLFDLSTMPLFGFSEKEISYKNPSWTRVAFEDPELAASLFAGEWSFTVGYSWRPSASAGVPVSEIYAKTVLWDGIYDFA
jgi:hypothetical protein